VFHLPELPYTTDALEPWLSRKTIHYHHRKLHAGYVQRLNQLTRGTHLSEVPLAELVQGLDPNDPELLEIWRNAAQAWNHDFMWKSMRPKGGGRPQGVLRELLGSPADLRGAFKDAAEHVFGSGWVWMIASPQGEVQMWTGEGADNPMRYGCLPLLTCDFWEHAYYLDYPADRGEYADTFLDHLANWDFAEANYARVFG